MHEVWNVSAGSPEIIVGGDANSTASKKNRHRRASRWGDAPVLDATGKPKLAVLTSRDIEGILKPLARYRYLPADYVHAFSGGSLDYLVNRLALLSRQPNSYIKRPQQQRANASANCRRLVYELADRGIRVVQEQGLLIDRQRSPANFAHELMTCELTASVEIGAIANGIRFMRWDEILRSAGMPDSTRALATPYAIPVTVTHDRKAHAANVVADGEPLASRVSTNSGASFFLSRH